MERYPKYKDSGVEWIGEIPEHWVVKKLKYVFEFHDNKRIPLSAEIRGKMLSKQYDYYGASGIIDSVEDFIFDGVYILLGEDGANLLTRSTALAFKVVGRFWVNNHAHILTPISENLDYFVHLLECIDYTNSVSGSAQPKLTAEALGTVDVILPPKSEQTTVANYLDHKTAVIDDLITQKERLVALYEEEKVAIINTAVTQGINPNVKLKDSGIDWLGQVPVHWEVKKLKYVGTIKYGLGQPPKLKFGGLPLIRATNVFRGKIDEKDMIFVDPDDIPYDRDPVLKEFDIIVVRSGAYTADSAIIPKKYEGAITGYDMVFRSSRNNDSKFIGFILLSDYVLNSQLIPQSLRAAQPHLNREELGETLVLIPPMQEQTAIVQHIEAKTARLNAKISKTKKIVALQKEYRTALISEVVTGKIKVTQEGAS